MESWYGKGMELDVTISTVRIVPSAKQRLQALELLRSIQGPTQASPGCVECSVYVEEPPGQAILLVERWESEAALEEHIRSETYHRLLTALELSSRPPEIRFDRVSGTKGMDLIERIRGQEQVVVSH